MSSLGFLTVELQSLASETRRKHPEVREAADKSLAILKESPEQFQASLSQDGSKSEELLRPLLLGLGTKNAKVIGITLGCLQRLISLRAISQAAVPSVAMAMKDCINQGVDIQLRILQSLLGLLTNFPAVHGEQLGNILLICFRLQESRIAVVSSTAAATLRQLVMFIAGDRVAGEDQNPDPPNADLSQGISLPDGTTITLLPSAYDAYSIFEDLCLLANSEKAHFLKLEYLPKTFALELIESVLTNCHQIIRRHSEQLALLSHHLCPFLIRTLSHRPAFPLTLRGIRVLFLLLKQFSAELVSETEIFMMLLIKVISGDPETDSSRPQWLRVIAMEIIRGLCNDAEFIRRLFERYDSQPGRSNLFSSLIDALNRVSAEKPHILGVSHQIFGLGVGQSGEGLGSSGASGLDVTSLVANAASVTAGMVGMAGPEAGLSVQGSSMKLQCIDQLEKSDAPTIPETYLFLLALQSLVSLVEGFSSFVLPLYNTLVVQKRRSSDDKIIQAPPAFDLSQFPEQTQLKVASDMIEATWHGFLASLSFFISTNLSDELFADTLTSFQNLTTVTGALGIVTARDAFLTSISKFSIPPAVVSALETYTEPATPRTSVTALADNLGLGMGSTPPGLSRRNLTCFKVFISCSLFLAGSLGSSWFQVLETLQNADYVLVTKGPAVTNRRSSTHGLSGLSMAQLRPVQETQETALGPPLLSDLDLSSINAHIQRLFDSSRNLEDEAFKDFISALCKLSKEMVQMQASSVMVDIEKSLSATDLLSPAMGGLHRRRASGIHLPKSLVTRLIYRSSDIAWTPFTEHLLSIALSSAPPGAIRLQAARSLDDVLAIVPRNVTSSAARDLQRSVQGRVFDVLSRQNQVELFPHSSTGVEIRRLSLETLLHILQASIHTITTGWETIFDILSSVCHSNDDATDILSRSSTSSPPILVSTDTSSKKARPPSLQGIGEKNNPGLVRVAFQCLTLICDNLTLLSPKHLELCIACLGLFGKQEDTNIALTAATSQLWAVSDAIQSHRRSSDDEQQYSTIWMLFMRELLGLCSDQRPEVRVGSIQTLFRSLQLYGGSLTLNLWDECLWKAIFPLLEVLTTSIHSCAPTSRAQWDESKALTFTSIGGVFDDFFSSKLCQLSTFSDVWNTFVGHVENSFESDSNLIIEAGLRSLEKALSTGTKEPFLKDSFVLNKCWEAVANMGEVVKRRSSTQQALAPDIVPNLTQDSLLALIDVAIIVRESSPDTQWPLEKISSLMSILKAVLTYSNSPNYRPDIDFLTPLQTAVLKVIKNVSISRPEIACIVLSDLAEYSTLAFLAAFDASSNTLSAPNGDRTTSVSHRKLTYIALSKVSMPLLADLYSASATSLSLYVDGAVERVFSAFAVPIKLKYDCPAPSKNGNDPPLWKTASLCFLKTLTRCFESIDVLKDDIPDDHLVAIWHQIVDVFQGAFLADCSTIETWSLEAQADEEIFDRALVLCLEQEVIPRIGHSRVPDEIILRLARVLQRASYVHDIANDDMDVSLHQGTTSEPPIVPRERFSYWCFDVLFQMCSYPGTHLPEGTISDCNDSESQRVAALSLLPLITRCQTVLTAYTADEEIRGSIPFSRAREEELIYVLRRILTLRLWPGSMWAAHSSSPTTHASQLPDPDISLNHTALLSDIIKRGLVAHLFQLYPLLCRIATSTSQGPQAWASPGPNLSIPPTPTDSPNYRGNLVEKDSGRAPSQSSQAVELDAKDLARKCLEEIGKEMGLLAY